MSSRTKLEDFNNVDVYPDITNGVAKGFFNCMLCCGPAVCPSSIGATLYFEGDKATVDNNHFCWVLKLSPIPCFNGCGVGPCAQVSKFEKESDTVFVGTGESQLGGGCCQACCHNKGDKMQLVNGKIEYHVGNSMYYPPCIHGEKLMHMVPLGGAPMTTEMQR